MLNLNDIGSVKKFVINNHNVKPEIISEYNKYINDMGLEEILLDDRRKFFQITYDYISLRDKSNLCLNIDKKNSFSTKGENWLEYLKNQKDPITFNLNLKKDVITDDYIEYVCKMINLSGMNDVFFEHNFSVKNLLKKLQDIQIKLNDNSFTKEDIQELIDLNKFRELYSFEKFMKNKDIEIKLSDLLLSMTQLRYFDIFNELIRYPFKIFLLKEDNKKLIIERFLKLKKFLKEIKYRNENILFLNYNYNVSSHKCYSLSLLSKKEREELEEELYQVGIATERTQNIFKTTHKRKIEDLSFDGFLSLIDLRTVCKIDDKKAFDKHLKTEIFDFVTKQKSKKIYNLFLNEEAREIFDFIKNNMEKGNLYLNPVSKNFIFTENIKIYPKLTRITNKNYNKYIGDIFWQFLFKRVMNVDSDLLKKMKYSNLIDKEWNIESDENSIWNLLERETELTVIKINPIFCYPLNLLDTKKITNDNVLFLNTLLNESLYNLDVIDRTKLEKSFLRIISDRLLDGNNVQNFILTMIEKFGGEIFNQEHKTAYFERFKNVDVTKIKKYSILGEEDKFLILELLQKDSNHNFLFENVIRFSHSKKEREFLYLKIQKDMNVFIKNENFFIELSIDTNKDTVIWQTNLNSDELTLIIKNVERDMVCFIKEYRKKNMVNVLECDFYTSYKEELSNLFKKSLHEINLKKLLKVKDSEIMRLNRKKL